MTRIQRVACAFVLALVTALVAPVAAHAAGYQFWGFYHLSDGEWVFATEGPATTVPEDGGVDGYRFAVTAETDVRVPRDVIEFDELCADTPAQNGMKRVGLVIDSGRPADAPEGATPPEPGAQCVVADPEATSQEILTQAGTDLRLEDGMVCGIGGYPADGCAEEITNPTPEQLAADEPVEISLTATAPTDAPDAAESTEGATDGGLPPWAWAVGVLVILGLLGWAAAAARNRRVDAARDQGRGLEVR